MEIIKNTLSSILKLYDVRRFLSVVTLLFIDVSTLFLGLVCAAYLVGGGATRVSEVLVLAPALISIWLVIFAAFDLYDRAAKRRNPGALLGAVLSWAGLAVFGSVVYPQSGLSLRDILLAAILALILDGAARLFYEQCIELIYRRGLGLVPTLIIGGDEERARIRRIIEQTPSAYSWVGELNLNGEGKNLSLVRRTLDHTHARNVILAGPEQLSDDEFLDLLRSLRLRGVEMHVVPNTVALMNSKPLVSHRAGIPLLEVSYPELDNTQRALKRMLDVVGSLGALIVLSPLLVGVAILIRLTSPGPVLFRQKRVGADEKVFLCYKFRSMYQDAEDRQAELEARNEAKGAFFKMKNDPRITPIGRFMRRWSIDELPQLINVLLGEMSLVGPRPLPVRDFVRMSESQKKRLSAVPGITGYWQISGRSDLSFEDMVRLDLYYIENWSLSLDVKIIMKTVGVILRREGAY